MILTTMMNNEQQQLTTETNLVLHKPFQDHIWMTQSVALRQLNFPLSAVSDQECHKREMPENSKTYLTALINYNYYL